MKDWLIYVWDIIIVIKSQPLDIVLRNRFVWVPNTIRTHREKLYYYWWHTIYGYTKDQIVILTSNGNNQCLVRERNNWHKNIFNCQKQYILLYGIVWHVLHSLWFLILKHILFTFTLTVSTNIKSAINSSSLSLIYFEKLFIFSDIFLVYRDFNSS
jgi:hypothetical protein